MGACDGQRGNFARLSSLMTLGRPRLEPDDFQKDFDKLSTRKAVCPPA